MPCASATQPYAATQAYSMASCVRHEPPMFHCRHAAVHAARLCLAVQACGHATVSAQGQAAILDLHVSPTIVEGQHVIAH